VRLRKGPERVCGYTKLVFLIEFSEETAQRLLLSSSDQSFMTARRFGAAALPTGEIGLRNGNDAHAHWLDYGVHVIEGRNTMKTHILTLATCAFILACGPAGAGAEEGMGDHGRCHGMMGHGGMMGGGMMGRGAGMRVIFALMDTDGDGTVSLQEFQAAHEKIFKAMDTDKEGTLTLEEIQAFMRGTGKSGPKEHEHEND
jgi:hypothetical protein